MTRRLQRVLLAVVAVLVCVSVTGPFRGLASVRASIARASDSANECWVGAASSDGSHRCADVAPQPGVDLEAIESDLDEEDDDALVDVADETAADFVCAPLPGRVRPTRIETTVDTSRFARGPGLARGPPV